MPKAALNATALDFFNWRRRASEMQKYSFAFPSRGVRNWRKALALVRRECIPTRRVNALRVGMSQFTESNFSDVSHYCFTEHVEQFWQSSFIGMESTPRIRAFQSNNSGPTPKINDCFNTPNHTSPNANKLPTHKNFQSQHFQCFLSIRVFVN